MIGINNPFEVFTPGGYRFYGIFLNGEDNQGFIFDVDHFSIRQ
jgi:hypothetical protein